MAEPTIGEVFGPNASQGAQILSIDKANYTGVGLPLQSDSTAESLLAAIVLFASGSLTEAARALDPANRNITLFYSGQDLITQGTQAYVRDAYSFLLYRPTTLVPPSAGDY